MIRRPPRSTLFPTRRSSDLVRPSGEADSSRNCSAQASRSPSSVPVSSGGAVETEEHTSELQSQSNLVCRLLLEKKKRNKLERYNQTIAPAASTHETKHPCGD